jgi:hypothetical protein
LRRISVSNQVHSHSRSGAFTSNEQITLRGEICSEVGSILLDCSARRLLGALFTCSPLLPPSANSLRRAVRLVPWYVQRYHFLNSVAETVRRLEIRACRGGNLTLRERVDSCASESCVVMLLQVWKKSRDAEGMASKPQPCNGSGVRDRLSESLKLFSRGMRWRGGGGYHREAAFQADSDPTWHVTIFTTLPGP